MNIKKSVQKQNDNKKTTYMNFDSKAADWDKDVKKVERAKYFANLIAASTQPTKATKGLEFGCGTGLVSYYLKEKFGNITLADNSIGMLNVVKEKIANEGISNLSPLLTDLVTDHIMNEEFNAIFTLMTIHHVKDVATIAARFHQLLKPGGFVCIGDLITEDGSFHNFEPSFDGHNGFSRKEIEGYLIDAGFKILSYTICYEVTKMVAGIEKNYPMFFVVGQK